MKLWIIFAILYFVGIIHYGYLHEQVHVSIYEGDGIGSEVDYFDFPDFVTRAEEPCRTEACRISHNFNEVMGYPLLIFYVYFGLGLLFIIMLLEKKKINSREVKQDG